VALALHYLTRAPKPLKARLANSRTMRKAQRIARARSASAVGDKQQQLLRRGAAPPVSPMSHALSAPGPDALLQRGRGASAAPADEHFTVTDVEGTVTDMERTVTEDAAGAGGVSVATDGLPSAAPSPLARPDSLVRGSSEATTAQGGPGDALETDVAMDKEIRTNMALHLNRVAPDLYKTRGPYAYRLENLCVRLTDCRLCAHQPALQVRRHVADAAVHASRHDLRLPAALPVGRGCVPCGRADVADLRAAAVGLAQGRQGEVSLSSTRAPLAIRSRDVGAPCVRACPRSFEMVDKFLTLVALGLLVRLGCRNTRPARWLHNRKERHEKDRRKEKEEQERLRKEAEALFAEEMAEPPKPAPAPAPAKVLSAEEKAALVIQRRQRGRRVRKAVGQLLGACLPCT
jgi:hypothetical protein